ncbi:MAG: hypothetical protein QOI31_179 [Solirubrobacterales bacterium]|jgi:Mn2+/Fe2+ NRAMP family transporter|nr:hypothetical protein [Solirubrobacterales bacterium]
MPKNTLKRKTVGLLVAAMLMLGAMPGVAAAQGPTSDQYDPSTITFKDSGGGLNDSVGPLPFTGFDVIAMLAVALAVTGLGLALQRAVSREPKDLR